MVFLRTNSKSLTSTANARFSSAYKFSKVAGFQEGNEVYIIPLGLERGWYETACHRVLTHKINGKEVGFKSSYPTYINCHGIDEEGNRTESLCCTLAQMEKDRYPDKKDSGRRIISFTNFRIHLPVLILGNSLTDKSKKSYPVSKVAILNELRSEGGLKFAYIEMARSSFKKDLLGAYGKKLKEDGILDYELSEDSEEFYDEVRRRLSSTVIKVRGVTKEGFNAALKEYSFFPFDNPAIASGSPEGERDAIIGYKDNQDIQNKICEFMDLFNAEIGNMFTDWTEKELQDYYDSALNSGSVVASKANSDDSSEEEEIEVVNKEATEAPVSEAVAKPKPSADEDEKGVSDEEFEKIMKDPLAASQASKPSTTEELEDFEFDSEGEDDFFAED